MNQAKTSAPTAAGSASSSAADAKGARQPRRTLWFSIVERYYALRDRILASARFQRWAAGFPLTRWMAAKRASQLFDICAGFVYSQVLYACVRIGVFERLAFGPLELVELARGAQMTPAQMRRLLDAAVSLGLLQRRGSERYGLGMLGAALRGNPGVISMIEHHPMLYRDLEDPVRLLQGRHGKTELGQFWAYSSSQAPGTLAGEKVAEYSRLMAESQQFIAGDVLEAYDFSRHRRLMDVGGGEGAFLHEASKRNEDLSLMLFDLPAVAERARERLSPLGDRVSVVGGDLFSDRLPEGADAISLVRIVHDHDDGAAMAILRAVHRALPPGGTLILAEPMAGTRGALPMGDAYFGFYLLAMGHGRPRTPEELTQMLENAGFERPKQVRTRRPMLTQLIVARRA